MEETASLFTRADLADREKRRLALAKAEIETSLAEKELQDWYRGRSKSSDVPKTPPALPDRLRDLMSPQVSTENRFAGLQPETYQGFRSTPKSEVTSPAQDTKTRPPSYPRLEIKARQPIYQASEQNSQSFVSHRSDVDTKSFAVTPSARSDQVSVKEREMAKGDKAEELKREMERQRAEVLESIDRKMKTFESGRQQETYSTFIERKTGTGGSWEREAKGRTAQVEESARPQYDAKTPNLQDQCGQKDQEIARLQSLLTAQKDAESSQVTKLREEVERLTQDLHRKATTIEQLQALVETQKTELTVCRTKLESRSRLEADYTALAKELTEEKLRSRDGDLKSKLKQMEQEHQLLQRDYETLATMHKRALKDLKRVQSEESRSGKSKSGDELRRHFEGKAQAMEEEAQVWKEKMRRLVTRYFHALEKLQRDNKQLRQDQASLSAETGAQLGELQRRVTELRRSRPPTRN